MCITKKNKILISSRPQQKNLQVFEFPGGKVKKMNFLSALKRVIRRALIKIDLNNAFFKKLFNKRNDKKIFINFFICENGR